MRLHIHDVLFLPWKSAQEPQGDGEENNSTLETPSKDIEKIFGFNKRKIKRKESNNAVLSRVAPFKIHYSHKNIKT